jgi:SAM-dependent methyltransferase
MLLPYRSMPASRQLLNDQYRKGKWDYLWSLSEFARFSVVAGYCRLLRPGGSVLEVGCGEGVLQDRMDQSSYRKYVGIDLSDDAIQRAQARVQSTAASGRLLPVTFVVANALAYVPAETFDVIVFNESLEYFTDPVAAVRRYEGFLTGDGIFIVSIFRGPDTMRWKRIWRRLAHVYTTDDSTSVTNKSGMTWDIRVLSPTTDEQSA